MIRARQAADLLRPDADARIALDQHPEQLADLVNVVARLPLRDRARGNVARRGQRVHRVRRDAAAIALLTNDPEVAELEMTAVADEDIERREIAMERVAAVQLAEDLEDARNLATRDRFVPSLRAAREKGAEIAVACVLEGQAVQDGAVPTHQRKVIEHANRTRMAVEQLPEIRFAQPSVDP